MDEPIEFLASRRSKRSTAGNRMQAALAEVIAEDISKDAEDDMDFTIEKDEQDVFESDFESTDEEEGMQEDEESGEKQVDEEEKRERHAARSRLEKATAAAHARNKATFNPEATVAPKPKPKPRVRIHEDELPGASSSSAHAERPRKSSRTQTVLSSSATVERLKESQLHKSSAPKKTRSKAKTYTQAELIARALNNEEGNIREHRDYLKNEEEKRKQARVVRASVSGPTLRWVSKIEEEKVLVPPPPPVPIFHHYSQFTAQPPSIFGNVIPQSMLQQYPREPEYRMEAVGKNYLVHELGQREGIKKPTWKDSMQAMFGPDVEWDKIQVYYAKTRPLSRPVQMCPFTGKIAPYFDPQTGVPFSNVASFKKAREALRHEWIWDSDMNCYVEKEGDDGRGHAMVEDTPGGSRGGAEVL